MEQTNDYKDSAHIWMIKDDEVKIVNEFDISSKNERTQSGFTVGSSVDENNVWFVNGQGTVLDGLLGFVLPIF